MIAPQIAFKFLPTSCGLSNGQESKNMISLCHGNLRSNHLVLNVKVEEDHATSRSPHRAGQVTCPPPVLLTICDPVVEEEEEEEGKSRDPQQSALSAAWRGPPLECSPVSGELRDVEVEEIVGLQDCRGRQAQGGGPPLVQPRHGLRPQWLVRLQPFQRCQLHRVRRAVPEAAQVGQGEQLQPNIDGAAGDRGGHCPQGLGQAGEEPDLGGDLPSLCLRLEQRAFTEEGELQADVQV